MHIVQENSRSFSIETNGKSFVTPFFVPAISTIKTDWSISGYLGLLEKTGYPAFLISAYDIYDIDDKEERIVMKSLADCVDKGTLIFLDNGNYEAYWYRDTTWTLNKLKKILGKVNPDFSFSFDIFWQKEKAVEEYIRETITSVAKTASMQRTGSTIALIHSDPMLFPTVVRKLVDNINPEIVAIPERELGPSIFERAQTIKRIRDELNKTERVIPIHILGTGDPISILIYTLCGADLYDALVWCTNCVDSKTGYLRHFSQRDFVGCNCKACRMQDIPYEIQTMTHNLIFYIDFLRKIRDSIRAGKIDDILKTYLREKDVSRVKKIVRSTIGTTVQDKTRLKV